MRIRLTRRRAIALGAAAAALAGAAWVRCGPSPAGLLADRSDRTTLVVDRRGITLYEMRAGEGTRGVSIAAERLPDVLAAATVAAEDRRFFHHPGVDPLAVGRALLHNIAARRTVEGGSTITKQVAKLLAARGGPPGRRGVVGKIREAVLALRLEHRFSKREILALYLNIASYGNQIVGAERASRAYFGCEASMLTPAQAAFIAALPQQPSRFNPYRDPRAARARQRAVIARMREAGSIAADQAREALAERLVLARPAAPFLAPHFVEMVLGDLDDVRPARVETTLDAGLQAQVEAIVAGRRRTLEAHGAANVAVVVLDNATGGWLAWEGSGDYFDSAHGGAINGPLAPRQPGSALKPLTYALAFEQGGTPATVLPDIPSHFPTAEPGVLFSPRNYDGRYRGPLLARRALAGSENVPAVALASEVGVPALLRFYGRAGLTTFDRTASYYGLGITLGNAEVRLAELVAAYAAFARGGAWLAPSWDARVASAARPQVPLASPRTAFWITDILADAGAREFIFGRGGSLEFPFPVAVKTGTSQAYHDNWTIGYTRAVTVGVWVTNFDRSPLRNSSGITGAAPIFHAVMMAAERAFGGTGALPSDAPLATAPAGVEEVEICALSGRRASPSCPNRVREWLPPDAGTAVCDWHHATDEGLLVIWPPEYREWARQRGLLQDLRGRVIRAGDSPDHEARPSRDLATAPKQKRRLEIVSPPDGALYSIDPTLRREFQAVPLRVVTDAPGEIEWRVDGEPVGRSSSDEAVLWSLRPGPHAIAARDARGRTATTAIVVR